MVHKWKLSSSARHFSSESGGPDSNSRRGRKKVNPWLAVLVLASGLVPLAVSLLSVGKCFVVTKLTNHRYQKQFDAGQLHIASHSKNPDALRDALNRYPEHINTPDIYGNTVLFKCAALPDGLHKVALLVSAGAEIHKPNARGYLAIHAYPGSPETVRLLRMNGLEPDIFALAGHGLVEELAAAVSTDPDCVHRTDAQGLTALGHAAWNNQPAAGRVLIKNGAHPDLTSAARFGWADIVDAILAADPGAADALHPEYIYPTPIHAAIAGGSAEILEKILKACTNIQCPDKDLILPAVKTGRPELVRLVLGKLTGPRGLSGRVTTFDGSPVAAAVVDAWTWYPGCETYTNELGFFYFREIPSDGPTVQIQVIAEGLCPKMLARQPLGAFDLELSLDDKTRITGTAMNPDGSAAAAVTVRAARGPVLAEGVTIATVGTETVTDEAGRYTLLLEPDTYTLSAFGPDGLCASLGTRTLKPDEGLNLDIPLVHLSALRARTFDAQTGEPLSGVLLLNSRMQKLQGASDADGRLTVAGLPTGIHYFNLYCPGYARWWSPQALSAHNRRLESSQEHFPRNFDLLDFAVHDPNGRDVDIYLERAAYLAGRVLDPDGNPVKNAIVTAALSGTGNSPTGDTRCDVRCDNQGNFGIFLPASREHLCNLVAHDGAREEWLAWANGVTEPFTTQPGQVIENIMIRLTRPQSVRGRVIDAAGRAVPEVRVRAVCEDLRSNRYYIPETKTDREGGFILTHLRPAPHLIQTEPFMLHPTEAVTGTSVRIDAAQVPESITLTVSP